MKTSIPVSVNPDIYYKRCGKLITIISLLITLFAAPAYQAWGMPLEQLTPVQIAPINAIDPIEPSGLASCNNNLLMVSDKDDHAIYRLAIEPEKQPVAIVYQVISHIPPPPQTALPFTHRLQRWLGSLWGSKYDWEGITCDQRGTLYLASESYASILRIPIDGSPEWLPIQIHSAASRAGFFRKYNGYIEGIAWAEHGVILTIEREPRGIIYVVPDQPTWRITTVNTESSPIDAPTKDLRPDDFSDALVQNNHLYTLERNKSVNPNQKCPLGCKAEVSPLTGRNCSMC